MELLKPLEPLLKHKCFLGFQLNEGGRDHEEMQQVKNVTIYPIECFYPFNWEESFHADHITSATYTIHYSEGSWLKQSAPEA